jgi:hypothetical protein
MSVDPRPLFNPSRRRTAPTYVGIPARAQGRCGEAALWARALQRHRLQASSIALALADAT